MGKATRWLKGLLGMKSKDKENLDTNSNFGGKRAKKRWSFVKSGGKESEVLSENPSNVPGTDSAWLRSYIVESGKEQNKHAIAVAAATAAAADAAVAAAQAAVEVVRLTSHGGVFCGGRKNLAALKLQAVFRGYLARKALRALRGLVKLQARVRGYLVRKRAAATLYSMEALIRAQATVRSQRARQSINNDYRFQPEMLARKSIKRFDETRSSFHSKRFSGSYDPSLNAYDEIPKIVEIDTCGPKSRSRRMSKCESDYGDDQYHHVVSTPLPCPMPSHLSIPNCRHLQDFDYGYLEKDYKFATAHNTPRFVCMARANAPVTPSKSMCGDSFFRPYSNNPNYMTNTQSFRAKQRSHSAPRQRPDKDPKKRLSLNEIMASRSSFSGVRTRKPFTRVQEDFE